MERGPMALFGAIIAVGLGPALWLGAQFGRIPTQTITPVTVVVQDPARVTPGGTGAGSDEKVPAGTDTDVRRFITHTPSAKPTRVAPRTKVPTASPSAASAKPSPSAVETSVPDVSVSPSATESSASPSPSPSASAGVEESKSPGSLIAARISF